MVAHEVLGAWAASFLFVYAIIGEVKPPFGTPGSGGEGRAAALAPGRAPPSPRQQLGPGLARPWRSSTAGEARSSDQRPVPVGAAAGCCPLAGGHDERRRS